MKQLPRNRIIVGDARDIVRTLPADSVDCAISSPPYFRLRNYQDGRQIGLETHVDDYTHELLGVARSLKRVLKPSGSLWLNLGDTYSRSTSHGASEKSLVLAPERVAQALTHDGWILRNKVVWAKTNPMPTSVPDRLSTTHEVVYFFVRGLPGHPLGKNPGDVWSLSTAGYRGAHHAVFPEKLVERPILATCPERTCSRCGAPWRHRRATALGHLAVQSELRATCECSDSWIPGVVLDPFMGSGTVAVAAIRHRRDWLGIELNPEFARLAEDRLAQLNDHPPPMRAAA